MVTALWMMGCVTLGVIGAALLGGGPLVIAVPLLTSLFFVNPVFNVLAAYWRAAQ